MHKGMYVIDLGNSSRNDLLFNILTSSGYTYTTTSSLSTTFLNFWHRAAMSVHLTTSLATYVLGGGILEYAKEWYRQYYIMFGFKEPYARISSHFNPHMALNSYQYGIDSKNYRYPYIVKPRLEPMKTSLIIRLDDGRVALKPESRGVDLSKNLLESVAHAQNWVAGTEVIDEIIDLREKRIDADLLHFVAQFIELVPDYAELQKKMLDAQSKPQFEGIDKQAKLIYENIGFYIDILKAMGKYGKENEKIVEIQQNFIKQLKERYGEDTYLKQFGKETTLDFVPSDVNAPYFENIHQSVMQVQTIHQANNPISEELIKVTELLQRDLAAAHQLNDAPEEIKLTKNIVIEKTQANLEIINRLITLYQERNEEDDKKEFMEKSDAIVNEIADWSLKNYVQKCLPQVSANASSDVVENNDAAQVPNTLSVI